MIVRRLAGALPPGSYLALPVSWLSHLSPETSVMMQVPSSGAFVRALLPVSLTGGHTQ